MKHRHITIHKRKQTKNCKQQRYQETITRITNIFYRSEFNNIQKVKPLKENLKKVIFGQGQAIESLVNFIKIAKFELKNYNKPLTNYLFTEQQI